MTPSTLVFESHLDATPEDVWAWMVSVRGISRELWPILRMTAPRGFQTLSDVRIQPGQRLFRSWLLAFGVLPLGYSDLTLLELTGGEGFAEESPMTSMRLWRHERRVHAARPGTSRLVDRLTFEPAIAPRLTARAVRWIFEHRHAVLRAHFGDATI
jgi:ligand-binding SRPBCC domain-containing protein